MDSRKTLFVFALIALLSLTGSDCSIVISSGGGTSDRDKHKDPEAGIGIQSGQFIDAPVAGIRYVSGALTGTTGNRGEFRYPAGEAVRFFIGDIALGTPVRGKAIITPLDLVPDGTLDTPAVINIARLLQSLDSDPGDARITIPPELQGAALHSNPSLAAAIRDLDFGDETAFVNAAAGLIAVLTADYPFTAVLVDGGSARRHMRESLGKAGVALP
jgi:hypothetical protein